MKSMRETKEKENIKARSWSAHRGKPAWKDIQHVFGGEETSGKRDQTTHRGAIIKKRVPF